MTKACWFARCIPLLRSGRRKKKKTHGVPLVSTPWFVDTSKLAAHSPDTPQAEKSRIKATSKKCELLPSYFSRSSERETGIAYAANFTFPRTRDALSNLTSGDTRRNRNESNLARCLYFTGSSTRYVISNLRESGTYARRHTWFRERSIAHISSPSVISHHASFTRTCVTCHNVNTHTHTRTQADTISATSLALPDTTTNTRVDQEFDNHDQEACIAWRRAGSTNPLTSFRTVA